MDASTTGQTRRIEQCKHNAQAKSAQKRQATFEAIARLRRAGEPVTRAAVAREAAVSVVFLRHHADLVQAIEAAQGGRAQKPQRTAAQTATDQVLAAYRRRLEEMKRQLATKDAQLHQKQRELDRLYGKLAAGSRLTQAELGQALVDALQRVTMLEEQLALQAKTHPNEN
jgi:uncharacterized coiled-coil protein SlyX